MAIVSNPPVKDKFATAQDPKDDDKLPFLIIAQKWLKWVGELVSAINLTAQRRGTVRFPVGSAGNVALTPFALASVGAGTWRLTYHYRVSRPGTVSSGLQISVTYTNGGVVITRSSTNETGNLTTSVQSGTIPFRTDANTAISYTVTYATAGATPMQYEGDLILESLAPDTV